MARRSSAMPRSRSLSTTSKPALSEQQRIASASRAGLVNCGTRWYLDMPMTSATRFSANAGSAEMQNQKSQKK